MPHRAPPKILVHRGELSVECDPARETGRLLRQGAMDASYIDLADPRHLEFDYMRWMRIALRAARARRVLHVGGGACALARALAAEDPGGRQEVCEVDGEVLAIARDYLGLRRAPGLHVRRAEGRRFVARQTDGSWDAVVIDAFVGVVVPRRLITVEAMSDVARVAPLALVNVIDHRSGTEVPTIAAALARAFPHVWALGGRTGNTIVTGSARRLALERISAEAAADPSPARLEMPTEVSRRIAGTIAVADADIRAASESR